MEVELVTIKMLKDQTGSSDGLAVELYKQGKTYNLTKSLAKVFVQMGVAEKDSTKKSMQVPDNKSAKVPENKSEKDEDQVEKKKKKLFK